MVLVLLAILVIAMGTTAWFTIRQQEENVLQETQRHGDDVTRILSQSLAFSIVGYDYQTIELMLEEITRSQDLRFAQVLSVKGNIMAQSGQPPGSNDGWTLFRRDVMFDRQVVGHVVVGLDNHAIIDRLSAQKTAVLAREAILIALITLVQFLALSYLIVRPVSIISGSLNKGVDESGKIVRKIPLDSVDEFGRLASQFNVMRDQLNDAHERLQSKVEIADSRLTETNQQLLEQASELQRMNEELQRLAITDPLTGLYNRRYFEQVVETDLVLALRHGDINSLLAVDVDFFKSINDQYGHKTGDDVLVDLAQVLASQLRRTDLVCRIGGEEFVVLCRRTHQAESVALAEKLRQAVEAHIFAVPDEQPLRVTVSVGVVTFPDGTPGLLVEDYIHRADLALYHSKASGRNRVTHYSDIVESVTTT